ncbi:TonB-dependent receptor plug domain-containing protein [Massilia sp. H-1]|nr:TonB-dependent receptor plug domain-containing protein [Massilia sp. H-1]
MSQHYKKQPARTALAAALSAAFGLIPCHAFAQAAPEAKVARVEITGSSIKRLENETALPVQVIKREDIDKSGVTTAAELLKNISANTAPLSDGASITDGTSGQRGFNGANLRGLGVSSTLVLLNGRRLANFASPGDNACVDLNNIPARRDCPRRDPEGRRVGHLRHRRHRRRDQLHHPQGLPGRGPQCLGRLSTEHGGA